MERLAKEKLEGGMINDMGMNLELDVADLHDEVFCASKCFGDCTIGTFHVNLVSDVDMCVSLMS